MINSFVYFPFKTTSSCQLRAQVCGPSEVNIGGQYVPEEDLVSPKKRLLEDRYPLRPSHKWIYLNQKPEILQLFSWQHD